MRLQIPSCRLKIFISLRQYDLHTYNYVHGRQQNTIVPEIHLISTCLSHSPASLGRKMSASGLDPITAPSGPTWYCLEAKRLSIHGTGSCGTPRSLWLTTLVMVRLMWSSNNVLESVSSVVKYKLDNYVNTVNAESRTEQVILLPGTSSSSSRLMLRVRNMSWLSPALLVLVLIAGWDSWCSSRTTVAWNCLSRSRINSSSVVILLWALLSSKSKDDLRLPALIYAALPETISSKVNRLKH